MIFMLARPIDLGRYAEVLNIAIRFSCRLERIGHMDWPETDLSTLKPSETLYISAHGSNTLVEGRGPDALAKDLVAKGLTDKVVLKKIKLMSCGSGITAGSNVPYCKRLADELANNGGPKNAIVIGFDGQTTVCDQHGVIYPKDTPQSSYSNWHEFQTNHQADFQLWNQKAQALTCTNELEFMNNALKLLSVPKVQEAFDWLYENNKNHVKDKKAGKTYASAGKTVAWKKS